MVEAVLTTALWFIFTITVLLQSKVLLNHKVDPVTLSLSQSLVAMFIDVIVLKVVIPWRSYLGICSGCSSTTNTQASRTSHQLLPTRQQLAEIIPICGLWYSSKLLTLYSFRLIPMSMTYTLKAVSPLMSCLLSYIFKGRVFSWSIYLSLVPICGGVILATVGGFQFSRLGIVLGGVSTLAGVMYSMGMKELLTGSYSNDTRRKLTPKTGCRRLFICVPDSTEMAVSPKSPTLMEDLGNAQPLANESTATDNLGADDNFLNNFISSTRLHFHVSFFGGSIALALHFMQKWRQLHDDNVEDASYTIDDSISLGGTVKHVFLVLTLNGVLNFGSSFFSYLTMSLTASLTWQVFNTLKRLCVIVVSILFFGTQLKNVTIAGMMTAVFGVFCYNVIKTRSKRTDDRRDEDTSGSPVYTTVKIV